MVRRLAETEIDDKARSSVPLVVRKMSDLGKGDKLVWWDYDEKIVVAKLGTGTPLPPKFREFVP